MEVTLTWQRLGFRLWHEEKGRNVEGQCAIEGVAPLVTRPTAVLELHQAPVSSVVASKLTSAAVVGDAVYTWGEGASGKLGHGSGESLTVPSRVETLVGRSPISAAALGHHHSLFLDQAGSLWACGENKEGQCGFGTSLDELAGQHRRAYQQALQPLAAAQQSRVSPGRYQQYLRAAAHSSATSSGGTSQAEAAPYVAQGWGSLTGSSSSSSSSSRAAHQQYTQGGAFGSSSGWGRMRDPWAAAAAARRGNLGSSSSSSSTSSWHSSRGSGLAGSFFGGGSSSSAEQISLSGVWGGASLETHLTAAGLHPGQVGVPGRVGAVSGNSMMTAAAAAAEEEAAEAARQLGSEVVVGVAASKYFSVALTAKGEVWAFGADYNGALGSDGSSWQSSPRQVGQPISAALEAAGGAVAVAAGGTFAAALTGAGRVLVWGKLAGGSPAAPGLTAAAASGEAAAGVMFAEVCLPAGVRISSIAAGQQHLLLSDGQQVWVVGRWVDADGEQAGVAHWRHPRLALSLTGSEGVTRVTAGLHSSAVVTSDGRLWLWGRLVDRQHGVGILRRFGLEDAQQQQQQQQQQVLAASSGGADWDWAGFGGCEPQLVRELSGVKDVALGGWHAVALVE
ncbi:regulator of chromosome condensation 1/beta-lactamase-inhibitor protein II [Scenedesmus sp. NREL 46B-D3]|nr:regulator of chromosome condensation 1/beta-lactamase-inhibitor protein II [Scenedesmus sp. NREL 46B-D3]